jgi:hypothetical protein
MAEKDIAARLQRCEDERQIQNLMGKYCWYSFAGMYDEVVDMFALKTPGVKAELADFGIYDGPEGIQRLYGVRHKRFDRKGLMFLHTLTTPVIEVAGDGKTAKAVWISPGLETLPAKDKPDPRWAWCRYAVDFVREEGLWKFWHFNVVGIFITPYDKSWVEEIPCPFPPLPKGQEADRPNAYGWEYSKKRETENRPAPPLPYEKFDESTAYVK